ncbi:Phospholipase/carboxylesterase [Mycena amicta]|nr:Phospholipase/carboxylesterase [Mycena amicta]
MSGRPGLGDTGLGWRDVAEMLNPELPQVKWVLPHSPTMRVTANNGMVMPSWFDKISLEFDSEEDKDGMLKTVYSLNQLISAEVDSSIPANRVVLGGFSQGGAMTLLSGLTGERKLAGLAVLSGWLPLRDNFKSMVSDHAKSIPIFWGHGAADPLVRHDFALKSLDFLRNSIGIPTVPATGELTGLAFNSYPGVGHSINDKELADLRTWLKKALPPLE